MNSQQNLELPNKDTIFWVNPVDTRPTAEDLLDWDSLCPCIPDELTKGPCRGAFAESYICYQKGPTPEKDCVAAFVRLGDCLQKHNITMPNPSESVPKQ